METQTTTTEQTTIAATGTTGATGTQGGQQTNGTASSTQTNGQANGAGNGAAGGSEGAQQQTNGEPKGYWPEDWRQKLAEQVSGGNKDKLAKELKRLETMSDPVVAWSRFRDMESTWASRNFIKAPPKEGASEADIKEFHKALGVPDTVDEYFKDLKLDNGAVLGDADKPLATAFATEMHKAGATPAVVKAALNTYYKQQEDAAAALDAADETFKTESTRTLKDEFGPRFKRMVNGVATLFDIAPGGADPNSDTALFSRLMGGRTADGKLIGNDPDIMRWLGALAFERNPAATVTEDGDQGGASVDTEINAIEKRMRDDRRGYNKDEAMQARYRELLGARDKIRSKGR
jgi:hypothetical protein